MPDKIGVLRLAHAILCKAISDITYGCEIDKKDAEKFFVSGDYELWLVGYKVDQEYFHQEIQCKLDSITKMGTAS